MVASSQVNLVDGSVLFTPIRKFDEAVLFGYVRDRPDDRISCAEYISACFPFHVLGELSSRGLSIMQDILPYLWGPAVVSAQEGLYDDVM
jgi:hypothetical protein